MYEHILQVDEQGVGALMRCGQGVGQEFLECGFVECLCVTIYSCHELDSFLHGRLSYMLYITLTSINSAKFPLNFSQAPLSSCTFTSPSLSIVLK